MAIRNNTTSLGMGGPRITARQFQDETASQISMAVARSNYRKSFKSDAKVAELRQYVYKMVSSWSKEDKMAILAQYGDVRGAGNLDASVTEALIVRLKDEDLQILLRDIKSDEISLGRKVRNIRQSQKRLASKFSTGSLDRVFEESKNLRNPRNLARSIRAYDRSFRVPRNILNQFPQLRRELFSVIPDIYDRVELPGLAARMGIDFEENIRQRDLLTQIVNKTLLYVSLVLGRSRVTYSSAIIDPAPYKEILKYTTYGYLGGTGSASGGGALTPGGLKQLRDEAIANKLMSKQRFNAQNLGNRRGFLPGLGRAAIAGISAPLAPITALLGGVTGMFRRGVDGKTLGIGGGLARGAATPYDLLLSVLGGPSSLNEARLQRKARQQARKVKANDPEYLSIDRDPVDITKQKSDADLNQEGINLGLPPRGALETRDAYIRRILAIKKRDKLRGEQLERKANRRANRLFGAKTLSAAEEAERQRLKGKGAELDGTKLPYIRFNQKGEILNQADYAVKVWVMNSLFGGGGSGTVLKDPASFAADLNAAPRATNMKVKNVNNAAMGLFSLDSKAKSIYGAPSGPFKGISNDDPFTINVDNAENAANIKGSRAIRVFDQASIINAQLMEKMDKRKREAKAQKQQIEPTIYSMGVKAIKKEPATPVYVVNRAVPTDTTNVIIGLAKLLTRFIDPTGILGSVVEGQMKIMAGQGNGLDDLLKIAGLATGGTGRSMGRSTTHFISGDSLSAKPNPEQVSINWAKKSYTVKPIPQEPMPKFAEGGSRSASGQITRMNEYERQAPMKVYAVNPGITDLVDVGSAKVSMIGLVADMAGRLSSIENLLSIGNQQNAAVVAATSATASNINKLASKSSTGMNPFANGFPSDLDSILTGR